MYRHYNFIHIDIGKLLHAGFVKFREMSISLNFNGLVILKYRFCQNKNGNEL